MKFNDIAIESQPIRFTREEFLSKLSIESFMATNVIEFFKEGLPSISDKIKGLANQFGFATQLPNIAVIENNFVSTQKNKLEQHYLVYRDVVVQIPEGFTGEFLAYVDELISVASSLYEQTNKLLSEYRFVLSSIISNKEQRTSLKDLSENYARTAAARAELDKRLAVFFNNTTVSRARLVDVLPRYNDARDLVRHTRDLAKLVDQKSLKEIERSVKEVTDVMVILEDQLVKNEINDVSAAVLKNIANGAYELAGYVESVVAFHYAAISIISCVNLMMEKMKTFE